MTSKYDLQVLTVAGGWVRVCTFTGREGLDHATDFARSMFRAAPPGVHFRVTLSDYNGVVTDEVMFSTQHTLGGM